MAVVGSSGRKTVCGLQNSDPGAGGRLTSGQRGSDLDVFGCFQDIIPFDPEMAHGILGLCVSEQELDRPRVLRLTVDEGRLRAP